MKQSEIKENLLKIVMVNGRGDLACDAWLRPVIGQACQLIKQCKSGLLQVRFKSKFYSVPMSNVDAFEPPQTFSHEELGTLLNQGLVEVGMRGYGIVDQQTGLISNWTPIGISVIFKP